MSVELKNLSLSYGSTVALKDFNLSVEDGEFVVILGPSGGGKSTILRIIAGLAQQNDGDVIISGTNMNEVNPSERNVAMVFQNQALYPHMTVYNNIALNLVMKKLPKDEIDRKVREVAKTFGLEQILSRKPREISGGQAQRVGLARAMIRDPAVYLMDEPLSGLDAKFREEMRIELSRFHRLTKKSIIYVTHDQIEAMSLGDKIVVINNGIKIQEGGPRELYDNPEHIFVATFVGSPPMNILDFHRFKENPRKFLLSEINTESPFYVEFYNSDLPDNIKVGIRPSDFLLDKDGCIEVVLKSKEFLGSSIQMRVTLGDLTLPITANRGSRQETTILDAPLGTKLRFSVKSEALYIFDPQGVRIKTPVKEITSAEEVETN